MISPNSGAKMFQVYTALVCRPFPVSVLSRMWCNREHAQLPLLSAGIQQLCQKSNLISGSLSNEEPIAGLVSTLLQLSRLGHAVSCLTALKQAFVFSSGAAVLALCADKRASKAKSQFLSTLVQ